ncbi:hypothetical protein DB88DRAFT_543419 [Papiliotrema laurentii]|uniref:Uncharacterized protein n=1 Tax=Papiliotrema laurentii TaxID=5418 RepID=A0AAD9FVK5_PAPLA|nr:hypothetical protein DB88DRAFT_543419 [Papiliotrema laurentii]
MSVAASYSAAAPTSHLGGCGGSSIFSSNGPSSWSPRSTAIDSVVTSLQELGRPGDMKASQYQGAKCAFKERYTSIFGGSGPKCISEVSDVGPCLTTMINFSEALKPLEPLSRYRPSEGSSISPDSELGSLKRDIDSYIESAFSRPSGEDFQQSGATSRPPETSTDSASDLGSSTSKHGESRFNFVERRANTLRDNLWMIRDPTALFHESLEGARSAFREAYSTAFGVPAPDCLLGPSNPAMSSRRRRRYLQEKDRYTRALAPLTELQIPYQRGGARGYSKSDLDVLKQDTDAYIQEQFGPRTGGRPTGIDFFSQARQSAIDRPLQYLGYSSPSQVAHPVPSDPSDYSYATSYEGDDLLCSESSNGQDMRIGRSFTASQASASKPSTNQQQIPRPQPLNSHVIQTLFDLGDQRGLGRRSDSLGFSFPSQGRRSSRRSGAPSFYPGQCTICTGYSSMQPPRAAFSSFPPTGIYTIYLVRSQAPDHVFVPHRVSAYSSSYSPSASSSPPLTMQSGYNPYSCRVCSLNQTTYSRRW